MRAHMRGPGALEEFSARGGTGLGSSTDFRDALRLFGKANRDGGDYYNVCHQGLRFPHGPQPR